LRRNARTTLAGAPRAFALVWQAHRGFTLALALFSILAGIIPTASAWISKLLIDEVVAAVRNGGSAAQAQTVIWLAVAQLGLALGSALLQTLRNITQQLLQELTSNRVQVRSRPISWTWPSSRTPRSTTPCSRRSARRLAAPWTWCRACLT
jgi:ABC-type multidrug transport system fused ATPase/permease subunit